MANNAYWVTSLTGGGAGALDAIDGDDLTGDDVALAFDTTNKILRPYFLDANSGATESSPDVIAPDSNAGDKRWILIPLIHSSPDSGDYKIRSFRREANGELTYVYKGVAES